MMKKYITVAALLAAGTAFANAAVVTGFDSIFNDKAGGSSVSLENGDTFVMNISGGRIWAITSNADTWSNDSALEKMNAELGTSFTASDINGYSPVGSGQQNSWTDLSLTISSIGAGEEIVLYTLATAAGSTVANFSVSGLSDVKISYALAGGDGFLPSASYTNGALNYTLIKVTGTLQEDTPIVLSAKGGNKNAWGMVAYTAASNVPEPSAFGLLAGLGALALVASRRRRK